MAQGPARDVRISSQTSRAAWSEETERKSPKEKNLPRGSTRSKVTINEEQIVKVAAPPSGSRFKGYTSCVVQDLVIRPHVVNFQCERWLAPDAQVITDQPALTVTLDRNCLASCSSNTMRRRPRCHGC